MYTLDDITEGMVLRCIDDMWYKNWRTGAEYIVKLDERGLYIEDENSYRVRVRGIIQRLNGKDTYRTLEVVNND